MRHRVQRFVATYAKSIDWLLVFCVLVAMLFTLSPRLLNLAYGYIDPSFNFGVNKAAADHLSFGTDFIATYGPLGYLTANYLPANIYKVSVWLLGYAVVLGAGVYLFCRYYGKPGRGRWLMALALLYVLAITVGGGSIEWNYFATFLLWGFIYLRLDNRKRLIVGLCLSIIAAVFMLTKFTLGFGTLLTVILLPVTAKGLSRRMRALQAGLFLGGAAVVFSLAATALHIHSIGAYIKTALLMSNGFTAAMSLYDKQTVVATILVAITMAALILWPVLVAKKQALQYLFILPVLAFMWRYAVVRQDGHMMMFLEVALPLALMLFFVLRRPVRRAALVMAGIMVVACAAIWANKLPYYDHGGFASVVDAPIANVIDGKFIDFFHIHRQEAAWRAESAAYTSGAAMPTSMRQQIGFGSVDVFPWEAVIVEANNLRWQPRPSPFSFESYDPYFDNANAAYYSSAKAPAFIVWHNTGANSIDMRTIFWDEPKTFQAMLMHYNVVQASNGFMLLQHSQVPIQLHTQKTYTLQARWDTWSNLAPQGTQELAFARFRIAKDIVTHLQELAVRGGQYYVQLKTADGSVRSYRLVTANSSQGLLFTPLPTDWQGVIDLMSGDQPNASPVVAFRLTQATQRQPSSQPFAVTITDMSR